MEIEILPRQAVEDASKIAGQNSKATRALYVADKLGIEVVFLRAGSQILVIPKAEYEQKPPTRIEL